MKNPIKIVRRIEHIGRSSANIISDALEDETDNKSIHNPNFFYFSQKPYSVTIRSNRLDETIRTNGHIIGLFANL